MTHDEMIAVLEAARAGRSVESRPRFSEEQPWASRAAGSTAFDFADFDYRVAPEPEPEPPRELWTVGKLEGGWTWLPAYAERKYCPASSKPTRYVRDDQVAAAMTAEEKRRLLEFLNDGWWVAREIAEAELLVARQEQAAAWQAKFAAMHTWAHGLPVKEVTA